jgi:hypothetical protein
VPRPVATIPLTRRCKAIGQQQQEQEIIMGLDIMAYAYRNGERFTNSGKEQFHNWRNHHALLKWCQALDLGRGEPAWVEPMRGVQLDQKDLDRLETAVRNGELPDLDKERESPKAWQTYDLTFIAKARALISAGFEIEIVASW